MVTIYTDSKYAYLIFHAHGAIQKEQGYLISQNNPIKHTSQIHSPQKVLQLPQQVAIHCKEQEKGDSEIAQGNHAAEVAAKKTVLR